MDRYLYYYYYYYLLGCNRIRRNKILVYKEWIGNLSKYKRMTSLYANVKELKTNQNRALNKKLQPTQTTQTLKKKKKTNGKAPKGEGRHSIFCCWEF